MRQLFWRFWRFVQVQGNRDAKNNLPRHKIKNYEPTKSNQRRVLCGAARFGWFPPPFTVEVLRKDPVKKAITKRYPDGRTLTLVVDDDQLVEKMMTYRWEWDYDKVREEKNKGESVTFKYWVKGPLDVGLSYFGTYLFGKTVAFDFAKVTGTNLVAEDWRDEVQYDIAFPLVNIKKIRLESGFSVDEKENPFMKSLMHDMVVDALAKHENTMAASERLRAEARGRENSVLCSLCGENPCFWIQERVAVIANDENEHGHTFTIDNKSRRKLAYRHMFRVVNGGPGQKGVRKRLPACVETGVRALFPDEEYMGFKEE
jgi:hypothetical protein